jgi:hypothetical protein
MAGFAMVSAFLDGDGAGGASAARGGAWGRGGDLTRRIALGAIVNSPVRSDGAESRFEVALAGGQVYTIEVQPVPRGGRSLVSIYGPSGELIGSEGGWGRVRLVQTAPSTGLYAVSAEAAAGGDAFVLRVLPWTPDEVSRAIDDPLFVM